MQITDSFITKILTIAVIFAAFFMFSHSTFAATITVDSNDVNLVADAQCSLAEAIANANDDFQTHADCVAGSGVDTIEFSIGVTNNIETITGSDSVLDITSPIIINGLTQGNAFCGAQTDLSDRDLDIQLDDVSFRLFNGADGVYIQGISMLSDTVNPNIFVENGNSIDDFTLRCSNMGIDAAGINSTAIVFDQLNFADSSNITIGGPDLADTNIFANANFDENSDSIQMVRVDNVLIQNNWIGRGVGPAFPEFTGNGAITICGPTICGRNPGDLSTNVTIDNNIIVNDNGGVDINGITTLEFTNNTISGADAYGVMVGSSNDVIILNNSFIDNGYGGLAVTESDDISVLNNLLSGNGGPGLSLEVVTNAIVQGNKIGTDITGMIAYGNASSLLTGGGDPALGLFGVSQILIGGDEESERNIISGNDHENAGGGIIVFPNMDTLEPSEEVIIQGNYIGVAADGVTTLLNSGPAIMILGATGVLVGGTEEGEGNIIQGGASFYNEVVPTVILFSINFPTAVEDVSILGNSIYDTGTSSFGSIADTSGDFEADWTSESLVNDPLDTDEGPNFGIDPRNNLNHLLNYPEFTSYHTTTTTTNIEYILDVPAGDYRIEFFQNSVFTERGEGETFLTYQDITHTGSGEETFTINLPVTVGDHIAATATERNQATFSTFGATSEFSASATIIQTPVTTPRRTSSGGSVQQSVSNLQNQGKTEQAQELKDQFPHLFDNETPTIESLTKKLAELQALLAQLQSSPNTLSCTPSLKRGSTGEQVRILQTKLNITPTDGLFGPKTEQSVRTFQQHKNLLVDGVVGPRTCSVL